jgi:hypothetical protein
MICDKYRGKNTGRQSVKEYGKDMAYIQTNTTGGIPSAVP